ncbi:MAG: GAF domain-containing protein, partial [Chloroflexota bacterium]|nr:GAF domain-containing protein [Chloroflexota bacterium]
MLSAAVPDVAPADSLADPQRLAALRRLALLDTPPEPAFDRLTRLATKVVGAPVALVSLVEVDRQFFKSQVGLEEPWASRRESPMSHSFCRFAVASGAPFVVEDARSHPQVRQNPGIVEMGIVAYAGIPLFTAEGFALGTLCAIDSAPRQSTVEQIGLL